MAVSYTRYITVVPTLNWPYVCNVLTSVGGCGNLNQIYTADPSAGVTPGTTYTYEPYVRSSWKTRPAPQGGKMSPQMPPYQMTAYSVGQRIQRQFLTHQRFVTPTGKMRWYQAGNHKNIGGYCYIVITNQWSDGPSVCIYDEQSRSTAGLETYSRSVLRHSDVVDAINSVRSDALTKASCSYDLLTEIGEMRELPKLANQVSGEILRLFRTFCSKHSAQALRLGYRLTPRQLMRSSIDFLKRLGDDWMAYRYGVMPLVYSYRDIQKTLERGMSVNIKATKSVSPRPTGTTLPASTVKYVVTDEVGSITVRATAFSYYSASALASLAGVGFNPLQTLWELTPYSFVADWFVDVGSWIAINCSMNLSTQRYACISRRDKYTQLTAIHMPSSSTSATITNILPLSNWGGAQPPANPPYVVTQQEGDQPLDSVEIDSYDRYVIPFSVELPQLAPSLNWRRYADSAVMASNLLGRLVRSFK